MAENVTKIKNTATIDHPTIAMVEEAIRKSLDGTLVAVKKEQEETKLPKEVCCWSASEILRPL